MGQTIGSSIPAASAPTSLFGASPADNHPRIHLGEQGMGYPFVLDAWQPAKRCRLTSSHEFHRSPDVATGRTLYERIP
jgi:hypothetical protein